MTIIIVLNDFCSKNTTHKNQNLTFIQEVLNLIVTYCPTLQVSIWKHVLRNEQSPRDSDERGVYRKRREIKTNPQ